VTWVLRPNQRHVVWSWLQNTETLAVFVDFDDDWIQLPSHYTKQHTVWHQLVLTAKYISNPEKANNANTAKQNCSGFIAFYDTQPENEVALFYNAPEPTQGTYHEIYIYLTLCYHVSLLIYNNSHSSLLLLNISASSRTGDSAEKCDRINIRL